MGCDGSTLLAGILFLRKSLTANGLNPTWFAIGSTAAVDARDNTGTNPLLGTGVPIYLIDGNRVANNNADLWDGRLQTAINHTPDDSLKVSPNETVWTGTSIVGVGVVGGELGSARRRAVFGSSDSGIGAMTLDFWISAFSGPFMLRYSLYGISSPLTVPTAETPTTTPEPSSLLGIITLGGLMLGGAVKRARN